VRDLFDNIGLNSSV